MNCPSNAENGEWKCHNPRHNWYIDCDSRFSHDERRTFDCGDGYEDLGPENTVYECKNGMLNKTPTCTEGKSLSIHYLIIDDKKKNKKGTMVIMLLFIDMYALFQPHVVYIKMMFVQTAMKIRLF